MVHRAKPTATTLEDRIASLERELTSLRVAGGTARVKVDAAVTARISSLTGCPCAAQFTLNGRTRTLQIEQLVGSFGIENASITFVDTIPTGVPVTYNVNAFRFSGTGTIFGGGAISAITGPFGS